MICNNCLIGRNKPLNWTCRYMKYKFRKSRNCFGKVRDYADLWCFKFNKEIR